MSPELVGEGGMLNSCARKCDHRILKTSPNNEGMCKKMRSSNFEKKSPHEGGYERGEKMNVPRREKGGVGRFIVREGSGTSRNTAFAKKKRREKMKLHF